MNAGCCTGVNVFSGFRCWFEGNDVKVKNVDELLYFAFLLFICQKSFENFTQSYVFTAT